ncbi:uncharacterized protein STEHIDRAFT_51229 [Stereum hirsutum FP-91666 SS1]|uniref:uncharacterized protein n=1 Tax=Stereum hirsutum (strain FP-91666) TaxID=721885 RepID=UPI000440D0FD|nr:uncharacterized protein STEHIDRAFT_51229 [Stereum hirsutum FP-91666 SS1]EIM89562.1 hypothetical protein STEHIDRAFT_51229 [Stereum hirsutum FP-91666 SS1]
MARTRTFYSRYQRFRSLTVRYCCFLSRVTRTSYPNVLVISLCFAYATQVVKPMWPFFAASAVTYYLVAQMQDMGVRSEQWKNDPRNPYVAQIKKEEAHH